MLDSEGFDLWADGYDADVGLSDESGGYPFAGYREALGRIYGAVCAKGAPVVLDIGFGTAVLTARLYARGCEIWGQDFSPRMIDLARAKMPGARLYRGDFSEGLCPELMERRYDFIVATYSLHHLADAEKIGFIHLLARLLKPGGEILIGDIAFPTRTALEACRTAAGEDWDDDEIYFVAEEIQRFFPKMRFEPISHCAGIFRLEA